MGERKSRSNALILLLLAVLASHPSVSPIFVISGRIARNLFLDKRPPALAPIHGNCSDVELVESVTLLVTVKDTCSQKYGLLRELSKHYPRDMRVVYASPKIAGCTHVNTPEQASEIRKHHFTDYHEVEYPGDTAPIEGFIHAHKYIKTEYVVLMHNDAYPMEGQFVCELMRALQLPKNRHFPIAAPTIYEKGDGGVFVPHGHHQNLHLRPNENAAPARPYMIDYDLSIGMATKRLPHEFKEEPQTEFLEDHAFFGRTAEYPALLDPRASFTLEYMDMILNMRARNTSALYVPTARCVFDVSLSELTWEDIPYFVYKRSEQIGHKVRRYLTNKWDVEFANTGIWNYVRYAVLSRLQLGAGGLGDSSLPTAWEDHAALFFAWFQSVGFNRYDGLGLTELYDSKFAGAAAGRAVNVSRSLAWLDAEVPKEREVPQHAHSFLPQQAAKTWYLPKISFDFFNLPIGVHRRACDAADPLSYSQCGMAVVDDAASGEERCQCFTQSQLFDLQSTYGLNRLATQAKLPTRALMYGQMKNGILWDEFNRAETQCGLISAADAAEGTAMADCSLTARFTKSARIVRWAWYGQDDTSRIFDDQ